MRIIFMGTPEFAVPSLDAAARRHQLLAVVTQPDRRSGRGQKLQFSPVKERALQYQVPIYQPEKANTPGFLEEMAKYEPDAIIVVAFGHKIPKAMLELPSHGCINVHASLLPKYRGAAPIHHAIMNGERVTGVTTMYLSEGWDEGDLILQAEEPILPTDTAGTLHDRLALKGAALLAETLDLLNAGTAPRVPQDHQQATYAPKLSKADAEIDWRQSAENIANFVRGLNPWPTAYTSFHTEMIKVWEALPLGHEGGSPGEIMSISPEGILVAAGEGSLLVKKLQRQGARILDAYDAANGLRLRKGQWFGSKTRDNVKTT